MDDVPALRECAVMGRLNTKIKHVILKLHSWLKVYRLYDRNFRNFLVGSTAQHSWFKQYKV